MAISQKVLEVSLQELEQFVDGLRNARVCSGLQILARRDKHGNAGIRLILRDNLATVETVEIAFMLNDPNLTVRKVIDRLKMEFLACWDAIFTKAVDPSSYVEDGSPVMLTEEIDGKDVVRI